MTSNPARCALGRQLLARVVDDRLGLPCPDAGANRAQQGGPAHKRDARVPARAQQQSTAGGVATVHDGEILDKVGEFLQRRSFLAIKLGFLCEN